MAEIEQASLKSEQLSDKSSSPALPDDLSLDEHTAYQLLARECKVRTSRELMMCTPEPGPAHGVGSIGKCWGAARGAPAASLMRNLNKWMIRKSWKNVSQF